MNNTLGMMAAVVLGTCAARADEPKVKITFPNGAVGGWSASPMRLKGTFFSDRPYVWTKLPKEISGQTILVRGAGDSPKWLAADKVHVSRACTAFAIIRCKYNEKTETPDSMLESLEEAGWKKVGTAPESTAPKGEVWKWCVYSIHVPEGDVRLPAPKSAWKATVIYGFK
jgi:hypothetical protein